MAARGKRKLRNYFINKELQFKILIINLFYMLLTVVVTVGAVLFPLLCDMFISQHLGVQYSAGQEFFAALKRLMPVAIITYILVSLHLLFISHRFFGPLFNFTKTFKRISSGDLKRKVFIRKNDFMGTEKKKINHMIDGLSHLVFRVRNNHRRLIFILEDAISHIEEPDARKSVESAMELIRKEAEFVTEDLAVFELDNSLTGKQADGEPGIKNHDMHTQND